MSQLIGMLLCSVLRGRGEGRIKEAEKRFLFYALSFSFFDCFYRIDLWNASNLKFGDEFLGELRLPLKFLRQSSSYEAWYLILIVVPCIHIVSLYNYYISVVGVVFL